MPQELRGIPPTILASQFCNEQNFLNFIYTATFKCFEKAENHNSMIGPPQTLKTLSSPSC